MVNNKFLVLSNPSRYFIYTGGRGSGKSFAVSFLALMLTISKERHKILFTRYTLRSAAISIIPEFKEKIDLLNYNNLFHSMENFSENEYSCEECQDTVIKFWSFILFDIWEREII